MSGEFMKAPGGAMVPTNKYAAKRPYCAKHGRAMLDIGGEKKCPTCREEEQKAKEQKP